MMELVYPLTLLIKNIKKLKKYIVILKEKSKVMLSLSPKRIFLSKNLFKRNKLF